MKRKPGYILVLTLTIVSVILALTTVTFSMVGADSRFDNLSYRQIQATHVAEAGVDWAIRQLNADANYAGESNVTIGDGSVNITVSGTGNTRTIQSTGTVTKGDFSSSRTVQVDAAVDSSTVEFFYGVQIDGGGLTMSNSSRINGNVYSNGSITGNNNPTITGDVVVAGGLSDTPTVSWEAHDSDQFIATNNNDRDIAQSFTAGASDRLVKSSIYLARIGNPTRNITVRLANDNGGKPSTSSLATTVIPYSSVGLTASWVDFTFSSPPLLTATTKYWLVLDNSSSSSSSYWNWRKDSTDGYGNNTAKYTSNCCSGSPSWSNAGGDLAFRVWIGGTVTGISGVTIGSASNGTAQANQFTNTTVHGSSCPNQYCIVSNPAASTLPISDGLIQDWQGDAVAGGTTGSQTITNGSSVNLGPVKINGDLSISNSANVTITGTVWVTGNITVTNTAIVKLDPSYGGNSGIIIANGTINVSNSCQFLGAGNGSYILLLSTRDAKTQTSISVSNASTGVIYYAPRSRISFTNSSTAKEATGWGIDLTNSATVTYDSGLANASFSSGPGGGWAVKPGTWHQIN